MNKWLSAYLGSVFAIPAVFAVTLFEAFEPLQEILIAMFNLVSLGWIPPDQYGNAMKFMIFILLLVIINSALLQSPLRDQKKVRGVIAAFFSLTTVLFMPNDVGAVIGAQWASIGIFFLLMSAAGFVLFIAYKTIKNITPEDSFSRKLWMVLWWLVATVLTTSATTYTGVRVTTDAGIAGTTISWLMIIFPLGLAWALIMLLITGLQKAAGGLGNGSSGSNIIDNAKNIYRSLRGTPEEREAKNEKKSLENQLTDFRNYKQKIDNLKKKIEKNTIRVLNDTEKKLNDIKENKSKLNAVQSELVTLSKALRKDIDTYIKTYMAHFEKLQKVKSFLELHGHEVDIQKEIEMEPLLRTARELVNQETQKLDDVLQLSKKEINNYENYIIALKNKINEIKKIFEEIIRGSSEAFSRTDEQIIEGLREEIREATDNSDTISKINQIEQSLESYGNHIRDLVEAVEHLQNPAPISPEKIEILKKERYQNGEIKKVLDKLKIEIEQVKSNASRADLKKEYSELVEISAQIPVLLEEFYKDYSQMHETIQNNIVPHKSITQNTLIQEIDAQHQLIETQNTELNELISKLNELANGNADSSSLDRVEAVATDAAEKSIEIEHNIDEQKKLFDKLKKASKDVTTLKGKITRLINGLSKRRVQLIGVVREEIAAIEKLLKEEQTDEKQKIEAEQQVLTELINKYAVQSTTFQDKFSNELQEHKDNYETLFTILTEASKAETEIREEIGREFSNLKRRLKRLRGKVLK